MTHSTRLPLFSLSKPVLRADGLEFGEFGPRQVEELTVLELKKDWLKVKNLASHKLCWDLRGILTFVLSFSSRLQNLIGRALNHHAEVLPMPKGPVSQTI